MKKDRLQLNAVQTLALGFAGLILLGGGLLALPVASRGGEPLPFLDALFTAASASCVTGLTLYDTWTRFSLFGQAVILLLIQVGGLGFMSISILVSTLMGRRIGLHRRSILMDAVGALQVGGVVRLVRRALGLTAVCEGLGAAALAFWFCPRYGMARGLWMSVFHAISAFCNAGFDLLGTGASLTTVSGAVVPNVVLMLLIICGGLGFLAWDDVLTHGIRFRRWRLHSKIVLVSTSLLFAGGTLAFYLLERDHAFAGRSAGQQALMAAFQSVTPRTAGFNTVDLRALSGAGTLLTVLLMLIGAGSGSTGGGMKVNTFAVLALSTLAQTRRREDVNVFGRRLDGETIRKAYACASLYLAACLMGGMVLCIQGIPVGDALFEAVSAIGTVGLSRGVTATLPPLSKMVILLAMFAGRVGSMSVAMAVTRYRPPDRVRNVREKILIG
ncbi:TrkH family potassium uptake protein [Oscillibacter sp.]|uniref:TrkH family potassium uptake protein n=1 Tax=Oscillibacter sp. TaxID=1945593 RepID=UPI00261353EC|nr:potassium transporter TrkG [Oscillibacter sp.]MDD3347511.1 potassium transporter TrkG [Oscillibacter sp.]